MKIILGKIKSISDVITNSSSEVFVMCKSAAKYYYNLEDTNGCINIHEITWDDLRENWCRRWCYELEMICDICDININDIINTATCDMTEDDWNAFLELYHDVIQDKLIGFYWVDIEDHFEDAIEVSDEARGDSIWSDYRH